MTKQTEAPSTRWWLVFAVWSLPALVSGLTRYRVFLEEQREVRWGPMGTEIAFWYLWALATPLVFALVRRIPIVGPDRRRSAVILHLAVASSCSIALSTGFLGLSAVLDSRKDLSAASTVSGEIWRLLPQALAANLLIYSVVAFVGSALMLRHRFREGEMLRARLETQNAQLEQRLAEARLEALRSQLQPHFLFNTLHAISSLMDDDVVTARKMIARLSDLLRLTLESDGRAEVPLSDEIECLEAYLDIERVRLGERLRLEYAVEEDALDIRVPILLLQPLVENAVRYAVAESAEGGRIRIAAYLVNGDLAVQVGDDGRGPGGPGGHGIGLANTRARLAEFYGEAASLDLWSADSSRGTTVCVRLPARRYVEE